MKRTESTSSPQVLKKTQPEEFDLVTLGGAVGSLVVAQILKFTGNDWTICFWVAAGVYLIGAACWLFIDPVTPLDGSLERQQFSTS